MTFDEYIEKNTENKEVKPENNKKSKRHHRTNLSIERTEYDESIRKKGIYRILDDKLASYITECQIEAEKLRATKDNNQKRINIVKSLGRKHTLNKTDDGSEDDEVTV
jgi:hypothetical protein